MADDTIKKILVGLGLGTQEWKAEVQAMRSELRKQDEEDKKREQEAKTAMAEQLSLFKEITAEQKKQDEQGDSVLKGLQARVNKVREWFSELVKVNQEEKKNNEESKEKAEHNLFQGFIGGALGGGSALGGLATALIGGGIGGVVATAGVQLEHIVEKLGEAVKDFVYEIGPLQNRLETFAHLTASAGINAEEFEDKLTKATKGTVDDAVLIDFANRTMMQSASLSAEQIENLVGKMQTLSVVTGKDLPTMLNALSRGLSTGRLNMLAYQLQLDPVIRQQLQMTQGMESHERVLAEYELIMKGMSSQLERTGEGVVTVTTALTKAHVLWDDWIEGIQEAIANSGAFKTVVEGLNYALDTLIAHKNDLKQLSQMMITNATFGLVRPAARANEEGGMGGLRKAEGEENKKAMEEDLEFKKRMAAEQSKIDQELANKEYIAAKQSADDKKRLSEQQYRDSQVSLDQHIKDSESASRAEYSAAVTKAKKMEALELERLAQSKSLQEEMYQKDPAKFAKSHEEYMLERKAIEEKTATEILQINHQLYTSLNALDEKRVVENRKAQQRRQEMEVEAAEFALDMRHKEDERLRGLGVLTAGESQQRDLAYLAEKQNLAGRKAAIKQSYSPEGPVAQAEYDAAIQKSQEDRIKGETDTQNEITADAIKAANMRARREIDVKKFEVETLGKYAEDEFKKGQLTADQILDVRMNLARAEEKLAKDSADQTYALSDKQQQDKEARTNAYLNAEQARVKKENDVKASAAQLRYDESEKQFKLDMQLADAKGKADADEYTAIKKKIDITEEHIAKLSEEYKQNKNNLDLQQKIQVQLDQEEGSLRKLKGDLVDYGRGIQNVWDSVGKAFSSFKSGGDIGRLISGVSDSLGGMTTAGAGLKSAGYSSNIITGFGQTFKELFKPTMMAQENPETGQMEMKARKDGTERLKDFNKALSGAVSAVGGLSQVLSAQSGTQGLVSGAGFGGGLGGAIGGLFKGGGPIGEIIGAGVGAVAGYFIGAAKKATEEAARKLSEAFDDVVKALQLDTIDLKTAIGELEAQRQKTVEQLSGRKGGQDQLKQLLPQMDQQIQQLKVQQKNLVKDLQKELDALRAPSNLESAVTTIQGILEKYKQYAGAVGDAAAAQKNLAEAQAKVDEYNAKAARGGLLGKQFSDVIKNSADYKAALQAVKDAQDQVALSTENQGAAQEYLNRSVERYVQDSQKQLTQSEQTAIQDAIQLNDLYKQREEILRNAATAEYDVLSAGVLTRQRTMAQTKREQIALIEEQKNAALDQINQQIELAKYRVDAESQIFGLATDRITLEKQLMDMQKQTIMEDMARIAALAGLVQDMKSGNASPEQLNSWIKSLANLPKSLTSQYGNYGRLGYQGYYGES